MDPKKSNLGKVKLSHLWVQTDVEKTRLAFEINRKSNFESLRISAHRSLILDTNYMNIELDQATDNLRDSETEIYDEEYGDIQDDFYNMPITELKQDFDQILEFLFAEQFRESFYIRKQYVEIEKINSIEIKPTMLEKLINIWNDIFPNRKLIIGVNQINVINTEFENQYKASNLSDGERSLFYILGKILLAAKNSVLIIDEPELHLHKSILTPLWNKLISERDDCGFIFFTHDLEFVSTRAGKTYIVDKMLPNSKWIVKDAPKTSIFDSEITVKILGSKKPVLFCEIPRNDKRDNLHLAVCRVCYPNWFVQPVNGYNEVFRSVSMLNNTNFDHIVGAGLVNPFTLNSTEINENKVTWNLCITRCTH